MPESRCTNGSCTSTDAPIPLGNGRSKCLSCGLTTATAHEVKHWDGDGFAADEWAWA